MKEDNEKFEYSYSAPTEKERREIEQIKRFYLPEKEEKQKLHQLRTLDKKVKRIPSGISISFGVFGLFVFGLGMSMVLSWNLIFWGSLVSIVGIFLMLLSYPIYQKIYRHQKEKYGKEILRLADELLQEKQKIRKTII